MNLILMLVSNPNDAPPGVGTFYVAHLVALKDHLYEFRPKPQQISPLGSRRGCVTDDLNRGSYVEIKSFGLAMVGRVVYVRFLTWEKCWATKNLAAIWLKNKMHNTRSGTFFHMIL